MSAITDNTAKHRFEMDVEGDVAFLRYRRRDDVLELVHTEVPEPLRGRGHGEQLVRGVLDRIRDEGSTIVPICPFVTDFIRKHPEYQPLVHSS